MRAWASRPEAAEPVAFPEPSPLKESPARSTGMLAARVSSGDRLLAALSPERARLLVGSVAMLLAASAFRRPSSWATAIVVMRKAEGHSVTSRGDFAHWLKANDLAPTAHEVLARKVRPGHVLVWLECENGVGLCSLDVLGQARRFVAGG